MGILTSLSMTILGAVFTIYFVAIVFKKDEKNISFISIYIEEKEWWNFFLIISMFLTLCFFYLDKILENGNEISIFLLNMNFYYLISIINLLKLLNFIFLLLYTVGIIKFMIEMSNSFEAEKKYIKYIEKNPEMINLLEKNNTDYTYYQFLNPFLNNLDKDKKKQILENKNKDIFSFYLISTIIFPKENEDFKEKDDIEIFIESEDFNSYFNFFKNIKTINIDELYKFSIYFWDKMNETNKKEIINQLDKKNLDDILEKDIIKNDLFSKMEIIKMYPSLINTEEIYEYIFKLVKDKKNINYEESDFISGFLIENKKQYLKLFLNELIKDQNLINNQKFVSMLLEKLSYQEMDETIYKLFENITYYQFYQYDYEEKKLIKQFKNKEKEMKLKNSFITLDKDELDYLDTSDIIEILERIKKNIDALEEPLERLEVEKINSIREGFLNLFNIKNNFFPRENSGFYVEYQNMRNRLDLVIKEENYNITSEKNKNYKNNTLYAEYSNYVGFNNLRIDNGLENKIKEIFIEEFIKIKQTLNDFIHDVINLNITKENEECKNLLRIEEEESTTLFIIIYDMFFDKKRNYSKEFSKNFLNNSYNFVLPKYYKGLFLNIHFKLTYKLFQETKNIYGLTPPSNFDYYNEREEFKFCFIMNTLYLHFKSIYEFDDLEKVDDSHYYVINSNIKKIDKIKKEDIAIKDSFYIELGGYQIKKYKLKDEYKENQIVTIETKNVFYLNASIFYKYLFNKMLEEGKYDLTKENVDLNRLNKIYEKAMKIEW